MLVKGDRVLILVLMEWRKNTTRLRTSRSRRSFNPCSNGMKKELLYAMWPFNNEIVLILVLMEWRKNIGGHAIQAAHECVLILVLMEWRKNMGCCPRTSGQNVLILVLMEWRKNQIIVLKQIMAKSFNPCSNGMKKEPVLNTFALVLFSVLILVLMEWRKNWWRRLRFSLKIRFNPCSNGMKKEPASSLPSQIGLAVLILVLMEWRKNQGTDRGCWHGEVF